MKQIIKWYLKPHRIFVTISLFIMFAALHGFVYSIIVTSVMIILFTFLYYIKPKKYV